MRKIITFLVLLSFAITAWAGEKTITISRNDVDWENANTVYNVTKGGVELVMSGGMNNPNFLLMKQHTTITVKSHNFNIKRIVFHCLDNYTNDNLDPFYWGPTTLHIQYSQTHAETAGTLTYNYGGSSYDALWRSTKSTSPGNYPNGLPAGYELMFENEGKPVRFASIDITIEQETGDMYELVTSTSEINTTDNYMLVGRNSSTTTTGRALSVNPTGTSTQDNQTSVPVTLIDNGLRVKAVDDVQFINFKSSSTSTYNYYIKTGEQYLRSQSAYQSPGNYNNGFCLTKVPNATDYAKVKVVINESGNNSVSNWEHYADIAYQFSDTYNSSHYAIRHNNNNNQFRNLYVQGNTQQIYLYKPSTPLIVTTEVKPESPQGEDPYGTISLRDGILVENGISYSQKMDTVQFLATPKNGYKIKSVTIQEVKRDNNTHAITEVVGNIDILSSSQSINGTLYNFVMPGNGAHVIVEFEEVVYHNVYIQFNPSGDYGNVFLTEGYVVQNDQVKSYEGENVVFNVTPNPIDIEHEENGYHELYSVTVTYTEGGQTISYTYTDGNYNFTMPDADVTITATFIYDNGNPLYLLGTANGGEFLPYGPRFNYDNTKEEYYLDVYFKGTNEFGGNEDDAYGYFCLSWGKWTTWNEVNQQTRRAQPYDDNYLISTDAPQYTLCYDDNKQNAFKIPAGIYRIKVKSYGYHNDVLSIERTYPTLTFDPAGGATAAEAVEVGQHQLVALKGDLYNKIKAINPNEADANFMYKATKTVAGEATTETENATTSTSTISVLNEVNDGETVTQLDGWNYLGWIVAEKTAYYKVIETPLSWIEENGEVDKTYTVSDQLQGVYAIGSSLWCKDIGNKSIVKTHPVGEQEDFMKEHYFASASEFEEALNRDDWDQSNWVELDFSNYSNGAQLANNGVKTIINAGTVTGVLTDKLNYKMKVTSGELDIIEENLPYEPNIYCTVNFLPAYLTLNGGAENYPASATVPTYYFLNPKIQEYAYVTWAQWDKINHKFVIPSGLQNGLDGAFRIGGWDYNIAEGNTVMSHLEAEENQGKLYHFHFIVRRTSDVYGAKRTLSLREGEQEETPSIIEAWPIDLNENSAITAISTVNTEAQVVGVEYVNIAGMRSDKPFSGVNIVVTRYSDGSTTTTKMVK